jgi:hypothetical protein
MIVLLGFVPFIDPLPIWSRPWIWSLLLLPLCAGVALIYKAVKCPRPERIFREAAILFVMILLGMIVAAAALSALVRFME